MRALVVASSGDVSLREWPEPTAPSDHVLVMPELVGLCGTDLELIDGTIDPAYVRLPLILGHEWVGRLGTDLDGAPVGTAVVVEGIVPCLTCGPCQRGDTNLCEVYDEIGFTRPGALADLIAVPVNLVHTLADSVAHEDAVLIEPMAVVWRALTRIPLREGLRVAIIGDGTVALLAAHLVRQFSPSHVSVIGRRASQRDLALQAGANEFLTSDPTTRYDLVIEAAGTGPAVSTAFAAAARGGVVLLLGLPPHGTRVSLAPDDVVNDDLIIHGSFSYTRAAFAEVVRRVNEGALRPGFLITQRFALEDASSALEVLRENADDVARGKVVVDLRS